MIKNISKLAFFLILTPNVLFSWTNENMKSLTDNCIEKTSIEAPQFSNEFILEYCECGTILLKNSMTWDEFLSLYESNQSLLTEQLTNYSVICAEKLLSQGKT